MNTALLDTVVSRLDQDEIGPKLSSYVLAACEGDKHLQLLLGGETIERGTEVEDDPEPIARGAYLESITVEGFRGVGPSSTLSLTPGPGLTLIVGRNGSGKSSFAEALEILLTGENSRWSTRSKVWKEGWRNLLEGGSVCFRSLWVSVELLPSKELGKECLPRQRSAYKCSNSST